MNSSSTFDISKSSLVSLKAEILRKREELSTAKLQNQNKSLKAQKPLEIKNKGVEGREERDIEEDVNLLKKSRDTLEAKAKLYDKLSKGSNLNEDEIEYKKRMLVQFDRKKPKSRVPDLPENFNDPDDVDKYPESEEEEEKHFSDEYEAPNSPGEEWVEYTDCLGRTRKCLRKDLAALKEKDKELNSKLDPDRQKVPETPSFVEEKLKETPTVEEPPEFSETSELLSSDMRREILRQQWEEEEEVLRNKTDIHYQDILFNEARSHGVGYYGFSKDEEERAKQQEELKKLRKETEIKQDALKAQKSQREKILAARLKAARNRKRARMGLPPEEDEPEVAEPETPAIDLEEEKRKKEQDEQEKLLDIKRKQEIRPWDVGKDGVKAVAKKHYELSQEEWVDKKRGERKKEFAPPQAYSSSKAGREFRSTTTKIDDDFISEPVEKSLYFSSKKTGVREKTAPEVKLDDYNPAVPPPNYTAPPPKEPLNPYKRKNYVPQDPVPIENECVDFDDEQERDYSGSRTAENEDSSSSGEDAPSSRRRGVEIAPPPTFEYYGPGESKRAKVSGDKANLVDSISAGLRFLRDQAEKKHIANEKRVIYEH